MSADDPQAAWLPSSNYNVGRGGVKVDQIIIHTTEGAYDGAVAWLRGAQGGTTNRESSAHYVVSADGVRVTQLVREEDTAWAAGNYGYNQRSVNIEQEGYAGKGGFSDGLYRTVGALVGRIAARHGIPLDRQHVIAHAEVPDPDHPGRFGGVGNHTDPGPHYDWERLLAIARGETARPSAAANDPNAYQDTDTGHWIINAPGVPMLDYWRDNGGVERLGRPLTGMTLDEDGVYRQLCENVLLECWPNGWGTNPGPYVRFGGLGQRYQRLRERAA